MHLLALDRCPSVSSTGHIATALLSCRIRIGAFRLLELTAILNNQKSDDSTFLDPYNLFSVNARANDHYTVLCGENPRVLARLCKATENFMKN